MIVTFYSFKGGVGRSMAVANVADILARQGRRVLMIDFDLEAPGLEQYFQISHRAVLRQPGLLDLLLAYKRSMSVASGPAAGEPEFKDLGRYIGTVYPSLGGTGCLDLLSAGQRETREQLDRYASNLRTFDWQDFYFNWEGELFFEWLRSSLVPVRRDAAGKVSGYDLVIVDSRTGVTEMGGICTYQLADVVVMLSAANHQNRQGTVNVAADFVSPPVQVARRDRPLEILAVPARVEQTDARLLEQFIQQFEQQFEAFMPVRLTRAGLGFRDLLIPYEPAYAFEERVISDPTRAAARGRIAGAFERLAEAVALLVAPDQPAAPAAPAAITPSAVPSSHAPAPPATRQYDVAKRFAGYDVFVSYAAADARAAELLVHEVKALGADVFADRRDLVAGEDWRARTEQAIFHSRVCLVCYGTAPSDPDVLAAIANVVASREIVTVAVLLPGASADDARLGPLGHLAPLDVRDGLDTDVAREGLRRLLRQAEADTPAEAAPQHADQRAESAQASPTPVVSFGAPYPGMRSFTEADAGFLFGRDDAIGAVREALGGHALVVLTGPSACGKTSLVEAGLVPALRRGDATETWGYQRVVAEGDPLDALERGWRQLEDTPCQRSLLFVDQLERLLRDTSTATQEAFFVRLAELSAIGGDARRIVVGVRDVRLPDLAALAPAGLLAPERVVAMPVLTGADLRAAIERPAERAGLAFEPGLVDRLVTDWGQDQRYLPFLQAVLHQLWVRRREGFLTNRAYDEIPDPVEALGEEAFASLPSLQAAMARVVPRLLALCNDLGSHDLSARPDEVIVSDVSHTDVRRILWHLVDARLVYAWMGGDGQGRVAPAFGRQQWRRAEDWYERDAEFLDWLSSLHAHRLDWERRQHDTGALLSGGLLAEARAQVAARPSDLTALEIAFIERSQQLDLEARRRARLSRAIVIGVAAVAVVALSVQAYWSRTSIDAVVAQQKTAEAMAKAAAIHVEAGDRAASQGDPAGAIGHYGEALRENPGDATALMRRGALHDQVGDFSKAIEDFSQVLTQVEGTASSTATTLLAEAHQARALAYLHSNELDRALADIDEALRHRPADAVALASRGAILERIGREAEAGSPAQAARFNDALTAYDAALAEKDVPDVRFSRGVLLELVGKAGAAAADFRAVAESKDASPLAQQAARARLDSSQQASPGPVQVADRPSTRVAMFIGDTADLDVAVRVQMGLEARGYVVQSRRLMTTRVTGAEVRYFFNQDEHVATEVQAIAGSAVAASGYNVDVSVRLLAAGADRSVGSIEVWLPSLSQALPSLRRAYKAKY